MKKPPSSSIGTIPEEGIEISSLEHGGWRSYVQEDHSVEQETLSSAREQVLKVLSCFSVEVRMEIIFLLEKVPNQGAGELTEKLKDHIRSISQPGVSHHLSLMRKLGIARSFRDGKNEPHVLSEQCISILKILRSVHVQQESTDAVCIQTLTKIVKEEMRMKILQMLEREPMSVTTMCQKLLQSQPGVSHHLAIMREQGVLSVKKEGKSRIYSLEPSGRAYLHAIRALEGLQVG